MSVPREECLLEFISGYVGDHLPDPHYTTLKERVGGLIKSNGDLKAELATARGEQRCCHGCGRLWMIDKPCPFCRIKELEANRDYLRGECRKRLAGLEPDITTVVDFVLGWWPAYEDAVKWGDDISREDHDFYVAAVRLQKGLE